MKSNFYLLLFLLSICLICCSNKPLLEKQLIISNNIKIRIPENMVEVRTIEDNSNGKFSNFSEYRNPNLHFYVQNSFGRSQMDEYGDLTKATNKYEKIEKIINGHKTIIYYHYGSKIKFYTLKMINLFENLPNYENQSNIIVYMPDIKLNHSYLFLSFTSENDEGILNAWQIINSINIK